MTVLLAAIIMLIMGFTSAGALQRLEARSGGKAPSS